MTRTAATSIFISLGLVAATGLAGCMAPPVTGRTAQADGVSFAYKLTPATAPHHYRVALALADGQGAAIDDAGVAVALSGPGLSGDDLVNLRRDRDLGPGAYAADVSLPRNASYRLTFQVNRHTAPSAEATFSATPPAG